MPATKLLRWMVGVVAICAGLLSPACAAAGELRVETVVQDSAVFGEEVPQIFLAAGDLTNDGRPDLAATTCCDARAAVFQGRGARWDEGTLLEGPSVTVAARPIVAPIRNDGQNWLVYTEHLGGNNGQWLRAHRYEGTELVENQDVATRVAWPGHHAASVADLDGDGQLEIWYVELYGPEPEPVLHLLRRVWDPAKGSYPGGEIADGGEPSDGKIRPVAGDFAGDGGQSLVWLSRATRLELVRHAPGEGETGYASAVLYDAPAWIVDFYAGEVDERPGTDVVLTTWDGEAGTLLLISGGEFGVSTLGTTAEQLRVVRAADLDGDGTDEVYVAGSSGGLYAYDAAGWRELQKENEGVAWQDGAVMPGEGAGDEVFFAGILDAAFQIARVSR